MELKAINDITSIVNKAVENDGIYGYVKNRGQLPESAPNEIYRNRGVFICNRGLMDLAFEQDKKILHPNALHLSDYTLYQVVVGDVMPKYSTYVDDIIQQNLFLISMGFSQHYGYEKVPIPFMPQYRKSVKEDRIELNPLDLMIVTFPAIFLATGFFISSIQFAIEMQNANTNTKF